MYGHYKNDFSTKWFCKTMLTALCINKFFMRTFAVHISKFMRRFNWLTITSTIRNRLISKIADTRITCISGKDRFTNIKCFDKLANTAAVINCLVILFEQTSLLTWLVELTNTTDLTEITFSCIIGTDRFTNF